MHFNFCTLWGLLLRPSRWKNESCLQTGSSFKNNIVLIWGPLVFVYNVTQQSYRENVMSPYEDTGSQEVRSQVELCKNLIRKPLWIIFDCSLDNNITHRHYELKRVFVDPDRRLVFLHHG